MTQAHHAQAGTALDSAGTVRLPDPRLVDYQDFFENGGIALHTVDANGTIVHANRVELALLGYEPEDYIGRQICEFHADPATIGDILTRLQRGERLHKYPARLRARDGSIKHVEITSSARFENGKFVHTRCFTVDVSDLRRAQDEARNKDDLFRQILEALPAAIYTIDAAGKINYYNRAAVELAGRTPEIGKDEWCVTFRLFTPDGEPLPHNQCPMAAALRENRSVRGVEALAQRPDGTLVPFLPFPTPLRNENGELIGAVNMLGDISERKEAEANQRVLLDELNHRVKNNMQMLHGLLSAAERETVSGEARAVLADAGQRVAAMAAAQKLLYGEDSHKSFVIGEFLHSVCESARQAFGKEIAVNIEDEDGRLSNDVAMPLALILNELMTNAAKHGTNGRGTGKIEVSLRRVGGEIVLRVEDDGPGFDPGDITRRSSGLGLVHGLARQLGGAFAVERGTGARCLVRFPNASSR
ncbi:MAG: PAS domain S-box protein [Alphaproteobacteria bacterium]|nr:PAS domain S-box protein [Alphaproteobacteria bacterium]